MKHLKAYIVTAAAFALTATIFAFAVQGAAERGRGENLRIAEDSVRRAVISCYAIEGAYPESYEYIKQNYGVRVDEDKYFVQYEIFASNVMPQILIAEK